MPFDAVLGVGREPRYSVSPIKADASYTGAIPFPQQEVTVTIPEGRIHCDFVIISVTLNNAVVYGQEVQVFARVGSDQLLQYSIPTGQIGQVVYQVIPLGNEIINPVSFVMTHGGIAAGGATNYTVHCTLFYHEI